MATNNPTNRYFTGDGATTQFTFTFPYLSPAHVKATVDGEPVEVTLISPSVAEITPAPANQTTVRVYRETPETPIVNWADGAVILGRHLNAAQTQALYIAQEAMGVSANLSEEAKQYALDGVQDAVNLAVDSAAGLLEEAIADELLAAQQAKTDAEGGDRELISENIHLYARHDQPEGDTSFPDFGNPEHGDRILERIRSVRPKLVVLDNLSTLATVDDDNAADAWDDFLKLLQKIRALGAAVLVVHHANKGGEQYRGSSKIPVMFDAIVRLQPDTSAHDVDGAAFLLDFTKTRMLTEDAGKTFNVAFADGEWRWDTFVDGPTRLLVKRFLDGEFVTQEEAAKAFDISTGEVSKRLTSAYAAGITTRDAITKAKAVAKQEREAMEEVRSNDF